jgi:hypothetical protein
MYRYLLVILMSWRQAFVLTDDRLQPVALKFRNLVNTGTPSRSTTICHLSTHDNMHIISYSLDDKVNEVKQEEVKVKTLVKNLVFFAEFKSISPSYCLLPGRGSSGV